MRMGLCAGRTVQLLRRGNPLIVRIHGARLGLSARLAELVRVESADAADPSTPLGSDPSPNREA